MADCAIKDSAMADSAIKDSAIKVGLGDLKYVCDAILGKIRGVESNIIFLLVGDIGAGKTTLVREFAGRIGSKDSVTSPTFSLLHIYNLGNLSWGMQFTRHFPPRFVNGPQVLFPSKGQNAVQSHTAITSIVDSASQNLIKNKSARSANPRKSFCYFWLLPKVESPLPLNHNLPNDADSALDSTNPQNLTRKNRRISHEVRKSFCYFWLKPKVESPLPYRLKTTSNFTIPQNPSFSKIYHYDLFNRNLSELLDLGLLDLLGENGIHFVEWGDSQLFDILKNAFENICIISIHKTKNDRIYEFKEHF